MIKNKDFIKLFTCSSKILLPFSNDMSLWDNDPFIDECRNDPGNK